MSDIRWLKRPSSPFSLFEDTNMCELMQFAASPVIALRAIRKACFGPEALTAALADMTIVTKTEVAQLADGPVVVPIGDEPTVLQCDECSYTCSTRKQLLCHSRVAHCHRHPINKCVDTTTAQCAESIGTHGRESSSIFTIARRFVGSIFL